MRTINIKQLFKWKSEQKTVYVQKHFLDTRSKWKKHKNL